jgi:hypothetical protein
MSVRGRFYTENTDTTFITCMYLRSARQRLLSATRSSTGKARWSKLDLAPHPTPKRVGKNARI